MEVNQSPTDRLRPRPTRPYTSATGTRREVSAAFAGPAARLTSWFRLPIVALLALIGPVVIEPRLNVGAYRWILAFYGVWAIAVAWWAHRRHVPGGFGWISTTVDLTTLVLLTAAGNGPTSYLQPFFFIQPMIVILQLRPRLTATVGLFIAGGYAAIWLNNLGQNGGPVDYGVVWLHFGILVWIAAVTTASTAFLVNRSATVLDLMRSRQKLITESIATEDSHRGRLAEDLHDGPLQNIIAARRNLEDIADQLPAHPLLEQTDQLLRDTAAALRGTVTVLHPQVLAQIGLAAALQELADQRSATGRFTVHTNIDDVGHPHHQALIYSTARELLTNIDRHAHADNAWITLNHRDNTLLLVIEDDGIGLAAPPQPPATTGSRHLGLTTHQIRSANAGGRLTVTLTPDRLGSDRKPRGTTAILEIPDPANGEFGVNEYRSKAVGIHVGDGHPGTYL